MAKRARCHINSSYVRMRTSLKVCIVGSALWLLIATAIAANDTYHRRNITLDVLITAVIPLSVVWGLIWILSGRKPTGVPVPKVPPASALVPAPVRKVPKKEPLSSRIGDALMNLMMFCFYLMVACACLALTALVVWGFYEAWLTYS